MKKNLMLPDYLFEISWEVCNKVGGIYTVVSTKARTLSEVESLNAVYIGPDLWKEKRNPLFTEDKRLWNAWRKKVDSDKLTVRCGYWEIPGRPKVILVDYTGYMADKDVIYGELWNDFGVDSLHGYGDYDDSMIFGYAVGKVIESFYNANIKKGSNVVVQAHEWQSGGAALYVKKHLPAKPLLIKLRSKIFSAEPNSTMPPCWKNSSSRAWMSSETCSTVGRRKAMGEPGFRAARA